jgi:hypothetical protein
MMRIDQRMPISGDWTQAAGLTEQFSMTGFESLLGPTWQRRISLEIPMLTQFTNPLRRGLLEGLNIPRGKIPTRRQSVSVFKDGLLEGFW